MRVRILLSVISLQQSGMITSFCQHRDSDQIRNVFLDDSRRFEAWKLKDQHPQVRFMILIFWYQRWFWAKISSSRAIVSIALSSINCIRMLMRRLSFVIQDLKAKLSLWTIYDPSSFLLHFFGQTFNSCIIMDRTILRYRHRFRHALSPWSF